MSLWTTYVSVEYCIKHAVRQTHHAVDDQPLLASRWNRYHIEVVLFYRKGLTDIEYFVIRLQHSLPTACQRTEPLTLFYAFTNLVRIIGQNSCALY